jgi:hypothetical protein
VKRKATALVLLSIGLVLFVLGFFVAFYLRRGLEKGFYAVKAGASFELSWYLEEGDRTEGYFNVSGGNGQANLIVKNPSGKIIDNWTAVGRYDNGFSAQDTGTYTMIFRNLDNFHDQTIYVGFLSPYDTIISIYLKAGLSMMIGSMAVLLLGILTLPSKKSNRVRAR